jgi:uncharacterized membrane-anchored protein
MTIGECREDESVCFPRTGKARVRASGEVLTRAALATAPPARSGRMPPANDRVDREADPGLPVARDRVLCIREFGRSTMTEQHLHSKVPAVTLLFWVLKIAATTLGETAGDTASMTLGLGYLASSALFLVALLLLVSWQIRAPRFQPLLYWATIIASTTAGTTLADFADRSLGIGYAGGSLLLFACVIAALTSWYFTEGGVAIDSVSRPRTELFYWLTITCAQTLGTALGDWTADSGLGYLGGALLFTALLATIAAAYRWTRLPHVWLFWSAFVLTRPLGATVGDFFDKAPAEGGLGISRPLASAVLLGVILLCLWLFPQRAGPRPHAQRV